MARWPLPGAVLKVAEIGGAGDSGDTAFTK